MTEYTWQRNRLDSVETVIQWMSYFLTISTKSSKARYRVEALAKKRRKDFERINSFCAELGISARFFFEVMFMNPIGKSKKGWEYPYLNFLAGKAAESVFLGRLDALEKRIGALDDVAKFVHTNSIGNPVTWYGNSYYTGYQILDKFIRDGGKVTLVGLFVIFCQEPCFTDAYIATHPYYTQAKFARLQQGEESYAVLRPELAQVSEMLNDKFVNSVFKRARMAVCSRDRQLLEQRFKKDEALWQRIWKMLA